MQSLDLHSPTYVNQQLDRPNIYLTVANLSSMTVMKVYLFLRNTAKRNVYHLQELCGKPERTCRRVVILRGIGSSENTPSSSVCCDVCTQGDFPYPTLDMLRPVTSKRRKNIRVRIIAAPPKAVLKENLL